jgi:hypothetical protein
MEFEHMRQTLEYYRKLREKAIAAIRPQLDEIRGFDAMIQRLASDLKEPANLEPIMGESVTSSTPNGSHAGTVAVTGKLARPVLQPDQFFKMSQSDAARAYLKIVGRAISMDELVSALQAGGAQVGGADPKRTLMVSLKANPKKEFVWPNTDTIGLAEFYANRK